MAEKWSEVMGWDYPKAGEQGIVLDCDAEPLKHPQDALRHLIRMMRNPDLVCRGVEARDQGSLAVPWNAPEARYWGLYGGLARICRSGDGHNVSSAHASAHDALKSRGDGMARGLNMGVDTLKDATEVFGVLFAERAINAAIRDLDAKLFTLDMRRDLAGRLSAMTDTYSFEPDERKTLDLAHDYLMLGVPELVVELDPEPTPLAEDTPPELPPVDDAPSLTQDRKLTSKASEKAKAARRREKK